MSDFPVKMWQGRQLNDNELFNQFINYWRSGSYQNALDIITDNAQLSTKSFVAGALNTINQALEFLQNNYFVNTEEKLYAELYRLNDAITSFRNQNVYNSNMVYPVNSFVQYDSQYYLLKKEAPIGTPPTDTVYWTLVGLKGEQGAESTGLTLKYIWDSTATYSQYDVVYYSDKLYVALQTGTNRNPSTATTYWQTLLTFPVTLITWDIPANLYEGQVSAKRLYGLDIANIVINGDFSDGTVGWLGLGIGAVVGGVAKKTATAPYDFFHQALSNPTQYRSHIIYVSAFIKSTSAKVCLVVTDGVTSTGVYIVGNNVMTRVSLTSHVAVNATLVYIKAQDNRTSGWDEFSATNFLAIDLTATFGAGNEPTKGEMDAILSYFPNSWFNGTVSI